MELHAPLGLRLKFHVALVLKVKLHVGLGLRVKLHAPLGLRVKLHVTLSLRLKLHVTLGLRVKLHGSLGLRAKIVISETSPVFGGHLILSEEPQSHIVLSALRIFIGLVFILYNCFNQNWMTNCLIWIKSVCS
jgi:hypothetical protein